MKQLQTIGGHSATTIERNLRFFLRLDRVNSALPPSALPTGAAQPLLSRFRQELLQIPEGDLCRVVGTVMRLLAEKHEVDLVEYRARIVTGDREALWSYLELPGRLEAYDPARIYVPWVRDEIAIRLIAEGQEAIKRLNKMPRTWQLDKWPEQRKTMVWQGNQWYEKGKSFYKSKPTETEKSHYKAACKLYTTQFLSRSWLYVGLGQLSAPDRKSVV